MVDSTRERDARLGRECEDSLPPLTTGSVSDATNVHRSLEFVGGEPDSARDASAPPVLFGRFVAREEKR